MKNDSTIAVSILDFNSRFLRMVFLLLLFIPVSLTAQTDSSAKKEVPATELPDLIAPSVELVSMQKGDNSVDLKAVLKAKVKGTFIKLPLLKVTFLSVTDSAENALGFVITDRSGIAVLNVNEKQVVTDKDGKFHFKAQFAGNKQMEPAEEEVIFKRAKLMITPVKADSLLSAMVKLVDLSTGTETPVPEATLGLYVSRLFNPLKIGEGTTDENGEATVEVPANLPGDAKGNIILLAKIEENEIYGNLESSAAQKWGIPVSDKIKELPRTLWSAHPPVWMLVTFAILMIIVWGHYIVILFELFRLRKEEPHATVKTTNT